MKPEDLARFRTLEDQALPLEFDSYLSRLERMERAARLARIHEDGAPAVADALSDRIQWRE
ncbi:hypothetical protein [Mesorhizobium sangaii]|uniref:Uncharacterized protein n=1 Tax=Mesorhizobium sangaii TaxID=505389 RepID=A0A841P8X0_9HYPH|nr:hypothetical protein [Mesorhizobium sangaii]MBB6409248.1 hypothetical protein [Mesorhizobium sangaii]